MIGSVNSGSDEVETCQSTLCRKGDFSISMLFRPSKSLQNNGAMKLMIRAVVIALVLASAMFAHDIITTDLTYTQDVSRILARRCVQCHGSSSSIPLTTYAQVRPWAVDIKEQVLSRKMPRWGAVKGFGNLSPDRGLTQEEIVILAAWVVGGAPQGDPALLPKSQAAPIPKMPILKDALAVTSRARLTNSLQVAGIRPMATTIVPSARVTAHLPDGNIEPLVWLYRFDPRTKLTFQFRKPLTLPEGTVVESSAPLKFALEVLPSS